MRNTVEKHSLRLNIVGRTFPVLVDEDEAVAVQQAAKMINDKVSRFRLEYGMRDEVDIVLMCCLDIALEFLKAKKQTTALDTQLLIEKLSRLEKQLDITQYVE